MYIGAAILVGKQKDQAHMLCMKLTSEIFL